MAIIHHAKLTPSKPAALAAWVPRQPWFVGAAGAVPEILGSPRLDDPDGEVGIETFLLRFGNGPVLQVPVTYRGAPLDGIAPIVVMEHSVLGRRFVHDGPTDPVYVSVTAATIAGGDREAALIRGDERLPSRGALRGVPAGAARVPDLDPNRARAPEPVDDAATVVAFAGGALRVWRRPLPVDTTDGRPHLVGSGPDGPDLRLVDLL